MSDTCWRCFKAKEACLCQYIKPLETGVKFVFLIHPKEAHQMRTGTGRLAHLSLVDSEFLIGVDFTEHERFNELLSDPTYMPFVLYPGEGAVFATDPGLKEKVGDKKLLVILIDGTWADAKKMYRLSKNLHDLPRLSFNAGYRTRFVFKREPAPDYISTIESCHYLVKELTTVGMANDEGIGNLMDIFDRMVAFQLECEKERKDKEGDGPQHPWRQKMHKYIDTVKL